MQLSMIELTLIQKALVSLNGGGNNPITLASLKLKIKKELEKVVASIEI